MLAIGHKSQPPSGVKAQNYVCNCIQDKGGK